MFNRPKNQQGLTLVEVLAAVVITFFIAVIIFHIFSSGQKEVLRQSEKNQQVNEISYVLKILTREIRKTNNVMYEEDTGELNVNGKIYKLENNTITENDIPIAYNIKDFIIVSNDSNTQFNITIKSSHAKVNTEITLR